LVGKRKAGSGVSSNGFRARLKKLLYIEANPSRAIS
jgi:hypothetical protein